MEKVCVGATVQSKADLEALRYCTTVAGDLRLKISDAAADYTALRDIRQITGASELSPLQRQCTKMFVGALLANGTSMSSLASFFSLTAIATSIPSPLVLNNKDYGVVVTGMRTDPWALTL